MSKVADPHEDPTTIDPRPVPATDVLNLRGAGDLTDTHAAKEIVAPAYAADPATALVLDLTTVTYLTMEAVIPFVTLARRCAARGTSLRVLASEPVRRKLTSLGLHSAFALKQPRAES
ncbi:anti-anti-sigma factor [Amycolatopsis pretoriensis]|uniref:Anti-anti-sigma factor n=1 Tax=Amycolatopsis pretoriensis TaxID=218821 RepID=A0A1H5RFV7_9PSEU|nr:STAS domain-containing protein [Amycolatopsis pretoriensis]SEF37159.1 anti-anti-sigma factor [Amycolatopsis pretoriensis]